MTRKRLLLIIFYLFLLILFFLMVYYSRLAEERRQNLESAVAKLAKGYDPDILIAQSALETGWFKHVPGNNYFGIKHRKGRDEGVTVVNTPEFINGKRVIVKQPFGKYSGIEKNVSGYLEVIEENFPHALPYKKNAKKYFKALQSKNPKYATDPIYDKKCYKCYTMLKKDRAAGMEFLYSKPSANASTKGGEREMPKPTKDAVKGSAKRLGRALVACVGAWAVADWGTFLTDLAAAEVPMWVYIAPLALAGAKALRSKWPEWFSWLPV